MEILNDYMQSFEDNLMNDMLRLTKACHMLDGQLLNSEDIDNHWKVIGPHYLADAVTQVKDYPTVSIAWAGYLGMAVAYGWDVNWDTMMQYPYEMYYGEQGYDDMDEHIVRDILQTPLDSEEAKQLEAVMRRCAEMAVDHIRREQFEPQSPAAYHSFARACFVMFRIGAAMELKRLGYKFEKLQ